MGYYSIKYKGTFLLIWVLANFFHPLSPIPLVKVPYLILICLSDSPLMKVPYLICLSDSPFGENSLSNISDSPLVKVPYQIYLIVR